MIKTNKRTKTNNSKTPWQKQQEGEGHYRSSHFLATTHHGGKSRHRELEAANQSASHTASAAGRVANVCTLALSSFSESLHCPRSPAREWSPSQFRWVFPRLFLRSRQSLQACRGALLPEDSHSARLNN